MQVYAYTDEVIDRLDAYALSIPRSPPLRYHQMHPVVHVPRGYLPIKIAQFFQRDPLARKPKEYHWSIFIPTSPIAGIGHYYELSGCGPPYRLRSTIHAYNQRQGLERGSHTVGYVLPVMLPYLEAHFALVPIQLSKRTSLTGWNGQNWVCNALQGLNKPHMFAIGMTFEDLVTQMAIVLAAWEAGNLK